MVTLIVIMIFKMVRLEREKIMYVFKMSKQTVNKQLLPKERVVANLQTNQANTLNKNIKSWNMIIQCIVAMQILASQSD